MVHELALCIAERSGESASVDSERHTRSRGGSLTRVTKGCKERDGLGILMHLTDLVRAAADLEYSRVTNIKN